MRTLSARILLGFAALAVAFGAITVNVVLNLTRVEESIHTIRVGYLPLALAANNLARREEDVKQFLDDGIGQESTPYGANVRLRTARSPRDASFKGLNLAVEQYKRVGSTLDSTTLDKIDEISKLLDGLKQPYDQLSAALRKGEALDSDAVTTPLRTLREGERRVSQDTMNLTNALEGVVTHRTGDIEKAQHFTRFVAIALGVIAIAIAVMISIWVVITLRPLRRLRDAAKRVAAGDYASRIDDRGPSEVAELAHEFNSMARAIEERERELVRSERLAAVGKLSAMITHEIRNPLSAIGLNAELLDDELADNEEGRALCRAIHKEVDRLTAITEEYLSFGKLPKPKIASEHVNAVVDALASFVREDLAQKHVELAVDLADNDPIALVDSAQLRQCLVNLVRNATEAVSSKGGGKVTLRTKRAGDRVVIAVEDTGVGIAPEVVPRLFDTFFSTKEGGSGLGLALTQQIVKDHGGDLAVESVVGKGTTFTVSIPRG
ncbi:MAG: ATP-binding protein [Kofleriaceae bacterium]